VETWVVGDLSRQQSAVKWPTLTSPRIPAIILPALRTLSSFRISIPIRPTQTSFPTNKGQPQHPVSRWEYERRLFEVEVKSTCHFIPRQSYPSFVSTYRSVANRLFGFNCIYRLVGFCRHDRESTTFSLKHHCLPIIRLSWLTRLQYKNDVSGTTTGYQGKRCRVCRDDKITNVCRVGERKKLRLRLR